MLDTLNRLAQRLGRLRRPALVLAGLCLLALLAGLFGLDGSAANRVLMPLFAGFLWFLTLYALIASFTHLPLLPRDAGWLTRMKYRLRRGGHWLIAVAFVVVSLGVLLLSFRLLGVWLRT